MTAWHRYLALEGASRATGKMITGAANLGFLFLVVSGLYLWFPRVWTWLQFKNVLWFRRGLAPKARHFNWHNAIGFWSAVPLAIVVAGALPISYPWASNLVYRLAGDSPAAGSGRTGASASNRRPPYSTRRCRRLVARRHAAVPAWRTITDAPGDVEKAPIVITVDDGYAGQPQKRRTLTFDRATAAIAKDEAFESLSAGRRARSWLRFAHTGEFYGLTGQTIAGLASVGGAFLVYTGLSLAFRRLASWIRRRRAPAQIDRQAA